ncbi:MULTISPECIES: aromatic acid exporter family protein [Bacillaceae]|uniref:FUSC family protein n=1 Tax=Evansella alkalicola TaxID=745819 RepID=A0ABS6JQP0_9BACI|nr:MULTISPECIES: aromatic acid exporter family protein [Bacillaceae]MBU9720861.1 FUSC family protein [Bacillus alkalicola]
MRLGARIFKTGLAVTLALYSALWLGFETPAFAALAAFLSVQPSVHKSIVLIWDQIQANILSAALAIIFVLAFGHEPFVVGVVIMLVIAIHLKLKKEAIIPLAVVTSIVIMGSPTDDFIHFAMNRFFLIFIGVIAAFIVNMIFLPPKHENLLYHKVVDTNDQIIQWIRVVTRHEGDFRALKSDLPKLKLSLGKIENLLSLYREERHYLRKNEFPRMRKVVLFRQMVNSTSKSYRILDALSKYENELNELPVAMQDIIRDHLDYLTNYQERIFLKYSGKVKQTPEEIYEEVGLGKRQLTDLFMSFYDEGEVDRNDWIHFFPVIALIIEYSEELERLDRLVDGFFKYHRSDNKLKIKDKEL